jgi:predicted ABC-type ATPase
MPIVVVIGGPNGAGKTTLAEAIVWAGYGIAEFVNADTIARGLSEYAPEQVAFAAGRLMLERLDELAAAGADFAFETTLASRTFAPWLEKRKAEGYVFHLHYVYVDDPEISINRVAKRVAAGGHHVPDEIVRRRWSRSIANFVELYQPIADEWVVYASVDGEHRPVADKRTSGQTVYDAKLWSRLRAQGRAARSDR